MLGLLNGPAEGYQPKLVVMKVLCKLQMSKISHPHVFFTPGFSLLFTLLFAPSSVLSSWRCATCVRTQNGCEMLSMSLPHCQAKYIQNSRAMERQGWWPISFHPLVFLSLFLFSSLCAALSHRCTKITFSWLATLTDSVQYRARMISRPLFRRWWMLITVQYIVPMSDCLHYPKFQWIIPFLVNHLDKKQNKARQ